ncbi:quercetin dioxygenase-like cupin family protein [Mycobacterium frederiksbergense]|uniref:Quercetin dioxygenase-like cupin family protein n=1 Tax=Mycolicibacterium frederiksbergense TaxID=117567 RepID=A0ABT6KZC0_9MYCO|nr:cupin domain-containing protein [Mycolicibacterium frederiksbergense]MDH6196042.1 quercetin dioxygenase-like cupin family protein [Mycolicibacterium frederiksbergense]
MASRYIVGVLALSIPLAGVARAHEPGGGGAGANLGASVVTVFEQPISNIPGKSVIVQEVSYAPGAKDASHRHMDSAFITAYVVSGSIRSQVEGEPLQVYHAGQTWQENPGAHHLVSENASSTEPAKLLAVFVADTADESSLTTVDPTTAPMGDHQ